jgi:hypothetical protein
VKIDLTQIVGCSAFALASLLCMLASGSRDKRSVGLWRGLAIANAVFAAEVLFGLRYRLHDGVNEVLRAFGLYDSRALVQATLLLIVLGIAAAFCFAIWRSLETANLLANVALIGTAIETSLFAMETVSLHGVDAVMYSYAGPIKVIGILWVGASLVVIVAAHLSGRR